MRPRTVVAGVAGLAIVALGAGLIAAKVAVDDANSGAHSSAKSAPLAQLRSRDAIVAVADAAAVAKTEDALAASKDVVAYAPVRPGAATEAIPSGPNEPLRCDAGGFIIDLVQGVDIKAFARSLPAGTDVHAWSETARITGFNRLLFDRLAVGPFVLVSLKSNATPDQMRAISEQPGVESAQQLTDNEYLQLFPESQRSTVPRPLPRVLDLGIAPGTPSRAVAAQLAQFPGVDSTTARELTCDGLASPSTTSTGKSG